MSIIYGFFVESIATAISEDGHVLTNYICKNESQAIEGLEMNGRSGIKHERFYSKYYPNWYVTEYVTMDCVESHEGLQNAIKLCKQDLSFLKVLNKKV